MGLVLRSVKGSKLTISEMDGNLTYLQSLSGASSGGTTNPAGNNSEVQFNDNNSFGATPNFTFNSISNVLTVNGDVYANSFYGDGSNLTGIISAGSIVSVTYDELFSNYVGNTLSACTYYLISDYQTCYDQPDFDNMGNAITSGNYKTGNTEPLIVLAISGNAISSNVYSPTFPNHTIKYDIDFTTTEVTNNLAKGRITERIDEYGNRADYDFVAVQFKRYSTYYCERFYQGTVSIDSGNGLVTGIGTTFSSDFIEGDVLAVYTPYNSPIGCFMYYEIIAVNDNTSMQVTGTTIVSMTNVGYSRGEYMGQLNPFQCNLFTSSGYSEYYTFNNNQNYNTYLGNYASLYNSDENTFLLSNNVFLNGNYENNVFGDGVFSNTFDDDMDSNTTGTYFQYNIINDDFDRNKVGVRFRNNIIICDMADNRIGNYFEYNMLGDDDGQDFDNNFIGDGFARNFLTFSNGDFYNNNIGDDFYENLIDRSFQNNSMIGTVYQNSFIGDFNENKVGYNFYQNSIYNNFWKNNIGDSFNTNTIGIINNIGGYLFENNEIMNNFKGNLILTNFWSNRLKTDFKGNQIFQEFGYNNIGFGCTVNNFSGQTNQNTIGDYCYLNNLGDFSHNSIGVNFSSNEIQDGFGFGGGQYKGNIIGNNFYDNTIGEYFYDNFIRDNFTNNTVVDYFQQNTITNDVAFIDFTTATTVYGYYNCNIFRRSDQALRLSYYDENDVLVITDITN
jgi:hypothetical protein